MAAAAWIADIATGVEILDELVVHAVLKQELDGAKRVLRDVAPEVVRVLDLLPEMGYREVGQCWHTGHGRILLSCVEWSEGTPFLLEGPPIGRTVKVHNPAYTTPGVQSISQEVAVVLYCYW
jgi:hypothetical protein